MTKNAKKAVSGAACAAAAIVLTAGAATPKPFARGTSPDVETSTNDCGNGLVLHATLEATGRFVARQDQNGNVLGHEVSTHTWTRTNPATSKTMVTVIKGLFTKDISLTPNPDGTLLYNAISPARAVVYAPDGTIAYTASGLEKFSALLDADGGWLSLVSDTFNGSSNYPGPCGAAEALLT